MTPKHFVCVDCGKYKDVEQNSKNKECTYEQKSEEDSACKNNLSQELLSMSNDQFLKGGLIAPGLN